MKKYFYILCSLFLLASCGSDHYPPAENGLVASQYFVDACLKGDFKRAEFYILPDTANQQQLGKLKAAYYKKSSDQRVEYRSANIIIERDSAVNANAEIITYKNSYDKIEHTLEAINSDSSWKIDLKHMNNSKI
ncbi:hypothetical protein [Arachidicoccus sp.]|uniref:hypothetical protein n=1 Tax=Arachidicoccus sp. TaxID=1872624 RepID=UPI003D22666D